MKKVILAALIATNISAQAANVSCLGVSKDGKSKVMLDMEMSSATKLSSIHSEETIFDDWSEANIEANYRRPWNDQTIPTVVPAGSVYYDRMNRFDSKGNGTSFVQLWIPQKIDFSQKSFRGLYRYMGRLPKPAIVMNCKLK